jgi:hypothetical protein
MNAPALKLAPVSTALCLLLLVACRLPAAPAAWEPAYGPLRTPWTENVSPTNAHPEYPRPQLTRPRWLNLNGLWDYALSPITNAAPTSFDSQILVPFPIESALSGVMKRLDEKTTLWYRRTFTIPADWAGQRIRLHFGAVDWRARVFLNGRFIGQHRGGYDGFTLDLTDALRWSGQEELVVAVTDPTEGDQPRGKQSRKPEVIFYQSSSGIWQTVWLEPVPPVNIDALTLTPDVDAQALRIRVGAASLGNNLNVEVQALDGGREAGRASGPINKEFLLPLPSPRLWSPSDPFLYDLKVTLKDGDRELDTVGGYFGMRKVSLAKDARGATRIALNNQFLFQLGALDQGFWPDGLYTAPTDAALRYDIEFLKQSGFNLARKHVKVEPDRWYYWCDKLGLLVWQDMPSGNYTTQESRLQFEAELQAMIENRRNHPSIVLWVLFNEGWGQYDTERLVSWIKALDPSRLVNNASGWTDKQVGDVNDRHSYPGPESSIPESERAAVLGEFGGLGLGLPGHTWSDQFWSYRPMADAAALATNYTRLLDQVHLLQEYFGLSAAVYTQIADVETECNGLMTYDRMVAKIPPEVGCLANLSASTSKGARVIVPNAIQGRVTWKYTTDKPSELWNKPKFDDSGWSQGIGGFGTRGTPGAIVNTTWDTPDIWLRREFNLNPEDLQNARLQVFHDESVEIYFNGVLAAQAPEFAITYINLPIKPEAIAAIKPGLNVIAIHCHQTSGGQGVDVGILGPNPATKQK